MRYDEAGYGCQSTLRSDRSVLHLLRGAVTDSRTDLDLGEFPPAVIERLLRSGLGPLLYRATRDNPRSVAASRRESVLSADLTARVIIGNLIDATAEILGAAGPLARHITLLKGIAVCMQYYPEQHHRLMRDIDLLVPGDLCANIESVLRGLGYEQRSELPAAFYANHHHGMPFYHPRKGVWVEVHTRLFPPGSRVASNPLFTPEHVRKHRRPIVFRGMGTTCLSEELHLIYTCAHWAESLSSASQPLPLIDLLYIIRQRATGLDWGQVERWAETSPESGSRLWIALNYLARRRLIELPPSIAAWLETARPKNMGPITGIILRTIIDKYTVAGRPFGRLATRDNIAIVWRSLLLPRTSMRNLMTLPYHLLFPPRHPERFRPGLLWRRLRSAVR
jgi:hypothetical protein